MAGHNKKLPILALDFDGVLHAYTTGWQGVDVIPDGPVPGATTFLVEAVRHFDVQVHSSRSESYAGRMAMYSKLRDWLEETHPSVAAEVHQKIKFPEHKPPALVTIDDRALTFTGTWPILDDLLAFKPWNKRPAPEAKPWDAAGSAATPGEAVLATVRSTYGDAYAESYAAARRGEPGVHGAAHDAGLRAVCEYVGAVAITHGAPIVSDDELRVGVADAVVGLVGNPEAGKLSAQRNPQGDWTIWWQGSGERGDHVMVVGKDGYSYDGEVAYVPSPTTDHAETVSQRHDAVGALVDAHNVEVALLRAEIEALRAQLEDKPDGRDSNLYAFAERELAVLRSPSDGPDEMQDAIEKCVLDIVAVFSAQGHSGSSAPYVVSILKKVLMFEPLGPLTGKDEEWTKLDYDGDMAAQSKRCPSVFKRADGTAYHSDAIVRRDPTGACYTGSFSRVDIEFPYAPKQTIVDVDAEGRPLAKTEVKADAPRTKDEILATINEAVTKFAEQNRVTKHEMLLHVKTLLNRAYGDVSGDTNDEMTKVREAEQEAEDQGSAG